MELAAYRLVRDNRYHLRADCLETGRDQLQTVRSLIRVWDLS